MSYNINVQIEYGRVPERPKGADCKSVVTDYDGSNPSPSTKSNPPRCGGLDLVNMVEEIRRTAVNDRPVDGQSRPGPLRRAATPSPSTKYAGMAELADAYGSGPYGGNSMEVQVLLPAPQ